MSQPSRYVWVTAETRWGTVRIRLPEALYAKARRLNNAGRLYPANAGSRDHICIKVRTRLQEAGARPPFIRWNDINFKDIAHSTDPNAFKESVNVGSPLQIHQSRIDAILELIDNRLEDLDEPLTLFKEIVVDQDSDYVYNPCGCVPFPLAEK